MDNYISREDAFELLKKYNQDRFHLQHALTVEGVMKWYATELGYQDDAEYWGIVGLLHEELGDLIQKTIYAMRSCETEIQEAMESLKST